MDKGSTTFIYMGDPQWDKFTGPRYDYSQWGRLLHKAYERAFGECEEAFGEYEGMPDKGTGEDHPGPLLVLGGDIVNRRNRPEEWDAFYAAGGDLLRTMRVISAMGNRGRTSAEEYRARFDMPDNGPEGMEGLFCSMDHGSCHFLILDTNVIGYVQEGKGSRPDQRRQEKPVDILKLQEWIRQDLEKNRQPASFVLMHHPLITAGTSQEDELRAQYMKIHLQPLIEEYPVDLILCGHQHLYARSRPIHIGQSDSTPPEDPGPIQIMGVSGTKHFDAWDPSGMACIREFVSNATIVTVENGRVRLVTIDPEGNVLDELIRPSRKACRNKTNIGKYK